jgi:hypothetical protein
MNDDGRRVEARTAMEILIENETAVRVSEYLVVLKG